MQDYPHPHRRHFLQSAAALMGGLPLAGLAAEDKEYSLKGRIYKTLKVGMIKEGETLTEKFNIAKEAGFMGVELHAPGFDVEEARTAVAESGLPMDGTVCADHWQIRHTDPDPAIRQQALETLKQALRDTAAAGGHTVLLVVGHGKDGPEEEISKRAVENISQAIPLAAELGVHIAVENVWNHFTYDHEGDSDQTADKLAKFVDDLDSPFVGLQFDIGNHWKYGPTGDWIRTLDQRIIKLDVKGFSRELDKFTAIGEGDLDWKDVRKALTEINYYGWCAAEVAGGDLAHLKQVSANMDRVFGL